MKRERNGNRVGIGVVPSVSKTSGTSAGIGCQIPAWAAVLLVLLVAALPTHAPASGQQRGDSELPCVLEICELSGELKAMLAVGSPDAAPLAKRVLKIATELLPEDPAIVDVMANAALAHSLAGDQAQARSLYEEALRLAEERLGPEHLTTAIILGQLGGLLTKLNELETADGYLQRALAIIEQELGPEAPEAAFILNGLGLLQLSKGSFASAQSHLERALEILTARRGPDHNEIATITGNLANVYLAKGDLITAQRLMSRALAVSARELGWVHPSVAIDLSNLGQILHEMGDLVGARRSLEQALEICEKTLPPDHPTLAATLINLGGVLNDLGLYDEAEKHLSRALEIQVGAVGGSEHPQLVCTLGNLGAVAKAQGDGQTAREFFEQARESRLKQTPADSHGLGVAINNLACDLVSRGYSERAVPYLRQAVDLAERTLGSEHPDLVAPLVNLARALEAIGELDEAVRLTRRALDLEERAVVAVTERGSLAEAELFLEQMAWHGNWAVSLHAVSARESPEALRLGLRTVLRWKGRALDTRARPRGVRDDPELDELAQALRKTREQWAFLETESSEPPAGDRADERCRLSDRLRLLSRELKRVQARYGSPSAEVTIPAVQHRLPERSALIEFFRLQPIVHRPAEGGNRNLTPIYLAYVLHQEGEPDWVNLGPAEAIDHQVDVFRSSLAGRHSDVLQHARSLYGLIMAPLRPLLGDVDTVLLSPDGALNLIPFAALVDEDDTYLVEHYELSYLSSGRDLLLDQVPPSREPPLVIGVSEFNTGRPSWCEETDSQPSSFLAGVSLGPLPGAADEAKQVGEILGVAPHRVLIDAAARERRIKQAHGPQILHVATHGVFRGEVDPTRSGLPTCLESEPDLDPLLRSFVALAPVPAGAATAAEDGFLTAMEILDLDLDGTVIVVLSACETGVGEVRPGRGVFGLRRALVLAGARTQVTSLWRVEDKATASLMTSWYRRLEEGIPRGMALRKVQQAALEGGLPHGSFQPLLGVGDSARQRGAQPVELISATEGRLAGTVHPYYWASFILVGDRGPLPAETWTAMAEQGSSSGP